MRGTGTVLRRRRRRGALLGGVVLMTAIMAVAVAVAVGGSPADRRTGTDLGTGPAASSPEGSGAALTTAVAPGPPRPASPRPGGAPGRDRIAFLRSTIPQDPAPKVYFMNRDGGEQTLVATTTSASHLRWSPDGKRFAVSDHGGIYLMNVDGTGRTQLSTGTSVRGRASLNTIPTSSDGWPAWSPDGSMISFGRPGSGGSGIYVMGADGSDPRPVTSLGIYDSTWSPDGKQIAFTGLDGEIHVVNLDGTGHRKVTITGGSAGTPDWSPDGTRLVFRRGPELAIISVGGGEPSVLVSPRGTGPVDPRASGPARRSTARGDPGDPIWSPDGKQIAYTLLESDENCSIWRVNPDGSGETRLTDGTDCDGHATWEPPKR